MTEPTITIAGDIEPSLVATIFDDLDQMLVETKGPIKVRICSSGGDTAAGFAIYDRLRFIDREVITEAYGEVSSIATLIFLAGDKRRISPNTRLMIHDGNMDACGTRTTSEMKRTAREMEVADQMYNRTIAERIGMGEDLVAQMCRNETYFSAAEAKNLGFAHEVIA